MEEPVLPFASTLPVLKKSTPSDDLPISKFFAFSSRPVTQFNCTRSFISFPSKDKSAVGSEVLVIPAPNPEKPVLNVAVSTYCAPSVPFEGIAVVTAPGPSGLGEDGL